jgi:hypothetical protein
LPIKTDGVLNPNPFLPNKAQAQHYPLLIKKIENQLLIKNCKQILGRVREKGEGRSETGPMSRE